MKAHRKQKLNRTLYLFSSFTVQPACVALGCAFLCSSTLFVWAAKTETPDVLLDAIRQVESNGGRDTRDGDGGDARGPYQIHKAYWIDATRFLGVRWPYSDARDEAKARAAVRAYLDHYGRGKSLEAKARIHNGGPRGDRKKATEKYWEKVKRFMPCRDTNTSPNRRSR